MLIGVVNTKNRPSSSSSVRALEVDRRIFLDHRRKCFLDHQGFFFRKEMAEDVGSSLGYAEAKYNCPHAAKAVVLRSCQCIQPLHIFLGNCAASASLTLVLTVDSREKILCAWHVGVVMCGRWRKAHMLKHTTESGSRQSTHVMRTAGHRIACGFQDLSFWCYG